MAGKGLSVDINGQHSPLGAVSQDKGESLERALPALGTLKVGGASKSGGLRICFRPLS